MTPTGSAARRTDLRRMCILIGSTLLCAWSAEAAANAKIPGSTYCIGGVCHRVKTIAEVEALVGSQETVLASFYDDCSMDAGNPCSASSSGEAFRPDHADNAASPIYPNGTVLLVTNPKTGDKTLVRVNDSGPYQGGRELDVSRAAAEQLGFARAGVASLRIRIVSAPSKVH
jgi:peptidoglycan lytic transglycosylase